MSRPSVYHIQTSLQQKSSQDFAEIHISESAKVLFLLNQIRTIIHFNQ